MASDMASMAKEFLLQKMPWGFEVGLCAFALLAAVKVKKIEKVNNKDMYWAQSLVTTFMVGFGGGILAPFLLGKPPIMFVNDLIVPAVLVAWYLLHRLEDTMLAVVALPGVKHVLAVVAEVFRANAMCGVIVLATKTLSVSKYYPIPFWGPVLLGTIGGCGGLFLPLDKGLSGIKAGAPWAMESAFYGSLFFHIAAHDPLYAGERLRGFLGPEEAVPETARLLVVLFFVSMALAQSYLGPSFNPFTPFHRVGYTITGVPAADAADAAAAPAAAAKPKGD